MAPSADVESFPKQPVSYYSKGLREKYRLDGLISPPPRIDPGTQFADIEYNVNEEKYFARVAANLAKGGLPTEVPAGWPKAINGPLAWKGTDFADESEYVLHLGEDDKKEVTKALAHFTALELEGSEVNKDNFPLGELGIRLEGAAQEIYNGKGFAIVRGLDPDIYSPEDLVTVYLGISSYVAEKRGKQDQRGSMIMHVMENEVTKNNKAKPFHTDTVCDCLALMVQNCSARGGSSNLSSVWAVYNDIAATRPDLIHVLAKPDWPFDTYGRDPPYYRSALMFHHDGKIMMNVSRRLLVGAPNGPRSKGIPGLTEAQAEALDAVHFTSLKYEIKPSMKKGDIRFINNLGVLHRREAFENEGDQTRHLMRLWLKNEDLIWKLPATLRLAWARVFDDNDASRGPHWDVVPPRTEGRALRVAYSCD